MKDYNLFEKQFFRFFEGSQCTSQKELALFLNVKEKDIINAMEAQILPNEWILKLAKERDINPDWVLHNTEPKFIESTYVNLTLEDFSNQEILEEFLKRVGKEYTEKKGL